jgi:tetratricopeptide (TPR) repeat protein
MVLDDYAKVIKYDTTFYFAYYNRANLKILLHDYDGAIKDLTKAINTAPYFPDSYYNRGLILIYLHKQEGCLDLSKAGEMGITKSYNVMKRYCNK